MKTNRRELLKLGTGIVPLVITLRPQEARANGSWTGSAEDPYEQYGLDPSTQTQDRQALFGSWQWRQARLQSRRAERVRRERYGGFGEFER